MKLRSGFALVWMVLLAAFVMAAGAKFYKLKTLEKKIKAYEKKTASIESQTRQLQEEIEGVQDPVWLELALMEELGVIPQGAIKLNYVDGEK
jgi:hypothetical protein